MTERELLICIINDPRLVEPILESFLAKGIAGATIVESRGMGQILANEIPLFTGLKTLFPGGSMNNRMILSVMTPAQVEQMVPVIAGICSNFHEPGTGVMFTLPVTRMVGLTRPQ